jgi:hypothetical protein
MPIFSDNESLIGILSTLFDSSEQFLKELPQYVSYFALEFT